MMYECHGHIMLNGVSYQEAADQHKNGVNETSLRNNLDTCRQFGIGFFRDGGDKQMVSAYAKKIASEYEIDYLTPIFAIHKKGFYGAMFGYEFENMAEFTFLVKKAKSHGADFIKLMASDIMNFRTGGEISGLSLCTSELIEAVKIARGEGLSVMAHVNGAENIKNALSAGVKSIEHGFCPDLEVVDYFVQCEAVWVPTRSPVQNLIGTGLFSDIVLQNILDNQKAVLQAAYDRNVLIASGSDSGALLVKHGKGTIDEYNSLTDMGLDPERGNRKLAELFGNRQDG